MKKRIIIPAILSAVLATGLTSCVKDNESDSVKNLRDAKAEELRGNAEAQKAAAAVKLAEAKYKEAQVAYAVAEAKEKEHVAEVGRILAETAGLELAKQKATHQLEIDAKVASATAALEKAKLDALKNIENHQKIKAEAEKAKAEAIIAMLKAQQELALQKSSAYAAAVASLTTAEIAVIDAEEKVERQKEVIKAVEAGTASVVVLIDKDKMEKEQGIASMTLAIKTLEEAQKYSVSELQAKYDEEKAKELVARIKYQNEAATDNLKNLREEKEALTKKGMSVWQYDPSTGQMIELFKIHFISSDFYKAFNELKEYESLSEVSNTVASHYATSMEYVTELGEFTTFKRVLSDGATYFYGNALNPWRSIHPSYEVNTKVLRNLRLVKDKLENDNTANIQKRKNFEKNASESGSIASYKKIMDDARAAWIAAKNQTTSYDQDDVNAKFDSYEIAQDRFNHYSVEYESLLKKLDKYAKHAELYDKVIALLESAEGIKNFNDAVAKHNEAFSAEAAQYFKQQELFIAYRVHETKANEYNRILTQNYSTLNESVQNIDKKIKEYKALIEEYKIAIEQSKYETSAAIAKAKEKLAHLEADLAAKKAERDAKKARAEALKP